MPLLRQKAYAEKLLSLGLCVSVFKFVANCGS